MLYGEKMKQILEKFNIDTSVLPDSLYSTLLDAIYNVEISGEGGIDTSSATAIASDILKSKTAYAKGVKITGTIESKGAETYTPKTTDQTINNGVYLSGVQTIKGDTNLNSANIKNGVTIFGVTGTLDDSGIDTSDATATSTDILKDKTAYSNGVKVTGTIESKGEETYIPSTTDTVINSGVYLFGNQTIKGDTNLVADNIKKDVTIFGVNGTMPEKIDTSDADATAEDIALGKTAYVNDVKITGTMESSSGSGNINYGVYEYYDNPTGEYPKDYIKGVNIPETVTRLGEYAFAYNPHFTSVTIPNSVTSIGGRVFIGCSGLTSINIPNSVTSIGDYALSNCSNLDNVTIPESLTEIGIGLFSVCTNLKNVSLPNTITKISDHMFNRCGLTSILISNNVTEIGEYGFRSCTGLTSVTIPNSVTSIKKYAFADCTELTSIKFPNNIATLTDHIVSNCTALNYVVIPKSVTSIEQFAFYNCYNLANIYFTGTQAQWDGITKSSYWNSGMGRDVSGGTKITYNYVG